MHDPNVQTNLARHGRAALQELLSTGLEGYQRRLDALSELATALRDAGLGQRALYEVFLEFHHEDVWDDEMGDVLDRIWSGPWALGHALFERALGADA